MTIDQSSGEREADPLGISKHRRHHVIDFGLEAKAQVKRGRV